ncbi:FeoC-like transcriptional regulator [Budvicia diplopodorum]|uniref:FeoC-like transcriptional regulator n=1 Tax=Budvicia diplopodorum TaxID=1119056 RepID=UPI001359E2E7|nr:FeoC-like transcriptional regulator [Budvicia diplopodorum]
MVSLIDVRDAVALNGIAELQQLSRQLKVHPQMLQAMLQQLESMGKIERIEPDDACLTGQCKSCPDGEKCLSESYRIKTSA